MGKLPESSNPKKEDPEAGEGIALGAVRRSHGRSQAAQGNTTGSLAGRSWRGRQETSGRASR